MKWAVRSVGRLTVITLLLVSVAACSDKSNLGSSSSSLDKPVNVVTLDVYKSRTCGCCKKWIDHIEEQGFSAAVHHPTNLNKVKADKSIHPRYQSCHTAISSEGYVFEGHIPVHVIQQFLSAPPENAIGLAVPGMPMGSPGMEMGDRRDEYDVLLLSKDGSHTVYEHVNGKR